MDANQQAIIHDILFTQELRVCIQLVFDCESRLSLKSQRSLEVVVFERGQLDGHQTILLHVEPVVRTNDAAHTKTQQREEHNVRVTARALPWRADCMWTL